MSSQLFIFCGLFIQTSVTKYDPTESHLCEAYDA